MPPFNNEPAEWDRVDWRLLQNGSVHLFWQREILDETVRWLVQNDYRIHDLDTVSWTSTDDALAAIAQTFDFPDYFGGNLNALHDCLGDVASFQYGSDQASMGTVLVMHHFDRYADRQQDIAQALLDSFASAARTALLIGHRMLCLAQSDDPNITFGNVGATPILWNPAEFLDSKRRP